MYFRRSGLMFPSKKEVQSVGVVLVSTVDISNIGGLGTMLQSSHHASCFESLEETSSSDYVNHSLLLCTRDTAL